MYSIGKMILKHPIKSSKYLIERAGLGHMDDREYVEFVYERVNDGDTLNLDHPVTYDDKLNWMKLYDRDDEYTVMADKLKVKDYVASLIGEKYVIPLIDDGKAGGGYTKAPMTSISRLCRTNSY